MTIILRFPGNVSWTSCRVLTWSTFPCGSCLTFWPRTCGLPRVWSTSTSSTRSAGSRRWSSSAGTRTSSSGRWGLGPGMVQTPHITLLQARHPSIQGSTMKIILQNLPLPEGDKLNFINSLNGLKTPLLQDRTVFILTFLLGKKISRPWLSLGWALSTQLVPIFQMKIQYSLFPAILILLIKNNVCLALKQKVALRKIIMWFS